MRSTQVVSSLFAVMLACAVGSIHAESDPVSTKAANGIEKRPGEALEETGAPLETDERYYGDQLAGQAGASHEE